MMILTEARGVSSLDLSSLLSFSKIFQEKRGFCMLMYFVVAWQGSRPQLGRSVLMTNGFQEASISLLIGQDKSRDLNTQLPLAEIPAGRVSGPMRGQ